MASDESINIYVADSKGYVWQGQEAVRLRKEHRLMGVLIGGVSQFKNQNAVNGLPLELNADEVTLAMQKGWAKLRPSAFSMEATATKPSPQLPKKRKYEDTSYDDYYASYGADTDGGGTKDDCDSYYDYYKQSIESKPATAATAANCSAQQVDQQEALAPAPGPASSVGAELGWKTALADGSSFDIPITPPCIPEPAGACSKAAAEWSYPHTAYEKLRFAIFEDLHSQGYTMSGGAKFGADMLAYPGDPSLYHAQFTVRLLLPGEALNPMLLKSAGRGSHAARKHLLLATVPQGAASLEDVKPVYISVAPEAGFGSKA